ncbi:MAG TPA: hypothetical protein VGN83_04505 [Falsiroseomonas sp.]|jgi:hypothetical protein|nr:hypothetical protein [Falsiroseomonas sp.]
MRLMIDLPDDLVEWFEDWQQPDLAKAKLREKLVAALQQFRDSEERFLQEIADEAAEDAGPPISMPQQDDDLPI